MLIANGALHQLSPKQKQKGNTITAEIVSTTSSDDDTYTVKLGKNSKPIEVKIPDSNFEVGQKVELTISGSTTPLLNKTSKGDSLQLDQSPSGKIIQFLDTLLPEQTTNSDNQSNEKATKDEAISVLKLLKNIVPSLPKDLQDKIVNLLSENLVADSPKTDVVSSNNSMKSDNLSKIQSVISIIFDAIPDLVETELPKTKEESLKLLSKILFPAIKDSVQGSGIVSLTPLNVEQSIDVGKLPAEIQSISKDFVSSLLHLTREQPIIAIQYPVGESLSPRPDNGSLPESFVTGNRTLITTLPSSLAPQDTGDILESLRNHPANSFTSEKTTSSQDKTEPQIVSKTAHSEIDLAQTKEVASSSPQETIENTDKIDRNIERSSSVSNRTSTSTVHQYQKLITAESLPQEVGRFIHTHFPKINSLILPPELEFPSISKLVQFSSEQLTSLENKLAQLPPEMKNSPFVAESVKLAIESLAKPEGAKLFDKIISQIEPASELVKRISSIIDTVKSTLVQNRTVDIVTSHSTPDSLNEKSPIKSQQQEIMQSPSVKMTINIPSDAINASSNPITQEIQTASLSELKITLENRVDNSSQKSMKPDNEINSLVKNLLNSSDLTTKSGQKSAPVRLPITENNAEELLKSTPAETTSVQENRDKEQLVPQSPQVSVPLPKEMIKVVERLESTLSLLLSTGSDDDQQGNEAKPLGDIKKVGDLWGMFFENDVKSWIDGGDRPPSKGIKQELLKLNHQITKTLVSQTVPNSSENDDTQLTKFLKDLSKDVSETIQRIEGGQISAEPKENATNRQQMIWVPFQIGGELTRLGINFRREQKGSGKKGTFGNRVAITLELKKMGTVNAELDLDAGKQLRVKIGADKPKAMAWFREHKDEIYASLEQSALKSVILSITSPRQESEMPTSRDSFLVSG